MTSSVTAFDGKTIIASGDLRPVALRAKDLLDRVKDAQVLIFDDLTSELVELDFRGTAAQFAKRLEKIASPSAVEPPPPEAAGRGPGRPRLGVVAREVTLLPRHWEWLATQSGGASVALRKLVEHAIKANRGGDQLRRAQEAAYRFASAMAGNEPGFEEAMWALFAGQEERFHSFVEPWPNDVRAHARRLAAAVFANPDS